MYEDRAKQYARHKYTLFFIDIVLGFTFLLFYQIFLSRFFADLSYSIHNNLYIVITVYITFFSVLYYIINLPINFYGSYVLEHKFSLSKQTLFAWIKDESKKILISFIIFLLLMQGFYLLLRKSGTLWWIWVAGGWIFFNIIFTRIFPTFIIPLFYKYSELDNASLKEKIKQIALKASVKLIDIFKIDFSKKTKKVNAALVGIGKSRRVILTDNLINDFTDEEIIAVCGHEFAHHKLLHIWKTILFFGAFSVVGFYLLDIFMHRIISILGFRHLYEIGVFPMILFLLSIFSLIIMPVQNAYSRKLEKDADRLTLKLTKDSIAFVSLMRKLAKINLSDENPPKIIKYLLYDHPPISERIKMAEEFRK